MNAAFQESKLFFDFDCVVFHDVDMLPENDLNSYAIGLKKNGLLKTWGGGRNPKKPEKTQKNLKNLKNPQNLKNFAFFLDFQGGGSFYAPALNF